MRTRPISDLFVDLCKDCVGEHSCSRAHACFPKSRPILNVIYLNIPSIFGLLVDFTFGSKINNLVDCACFYTYGEEPRAGLGHDFTSQNLLNLDSKNKRARN